jgi:hypothetical protein
MYKLTSNPNQVIRLSDGVIILDITANYGDALLYQQWLADGNTPESADVIPVVIAPNPKGFYEKMIGVRGDYPLFQVYQSISFQALDQTKDTSSLGYAVTVFLASLTTNDWSQEYAKPAYAQAYEILKQFLSSGQIAIVDAENIAFNLV